MSTAPPRIRSQASANATRDEDWPESAQKLMPRTSNRPEILFAISAPLEPSAA